MNNDRLVILDVDGTIVDAFHAVESAFSRHGMDIGDFERFQKRRKLLKYLGGLREFPKNLKRHLGKENRRALVATLTAIYREEAQLFPGIRGLLHALVGASHVKVGLLTRNITQEPEETLRLLLLRHEIDIGSLDFVCCIPLGEEKLPQFRAIRQRYDINPACAFACGDEYRDYAAAIGAGMHPFIASYGFEDHDRLRDAYAVPDEVISRTPLELAQRLCHALNICYAPTGS